jgi:hypothetical protein
VLEETKLSFFVRTQISETSKNILKGGEVEATISLDNFKPKTSTEKVTFKYRCN